MERLAEKLFSWASILDELTRNQAHKTASMPFIFPHLALMRMRIWARARPSAR